MCEESLRECEVMLLEMEREAVEDMRLDLDCSESEAVLQMIENNKEQESVKLLLCK